MSPHTGTQKKTEDAAENRLKAQNNKAHYAKKLDDEKKKVEALELVATQLQEEFTASYLDNPRTSVTADILFRTGQQVLKSTAHELKIPTKSK